MFFPRRINYFSDNLSLEVKEIYWNVVISNLASTMMLLFEPIFLWQLHYSLEKIIWFYMLVYLGYALFIFPVAKIVSRIGYKHSIFVANVFYALYWLLLFQIKFHPILFIITPFFYALQKSFFWPPYHADIALHNRHGQRGREVGALFSLVELASIVGPVLGGAITWLFGFPTLFSIAAFLILFSVYPLFRSRELYPAHQFHFINFWKIVRKYPSNFFGYWGYAEDLMLMTLWPIFVFTIVPGVFGVGVLITVANLVAIMLMLYLGKVIDQRHHRHILQVGSIFYGLTWLFRQFGMTLPGVFVLDTLTRMGKAVVNIPLTALSYHLADRGRMDLAIAYAVFYEFSLSIGKLFMALVAFWILVTTQNIYYVFIVTGILTMFYSLLQGKRK